MPKAKQAQPPPDDPTQSERFIKDAAELAAEDGALLFERAMGVIAKPPKLPVEANAPIIGPPKAAKKESGGD